ncbi:outer membrane lipoprotein chaperone LolA [Cognatilysobacter bugurensis]|uniref:Outer-membrane lipoprotein carrier protein n=1 Tax=Cognatilysobacter bugurensis TaxID=543356 RepID=A0A918SW82_9GAMM|nr:outer membrane lipoprotein chaperone LolA [Lysobacter bugurensis]GHA73116.1 outer-membrane lipoprotein carrier protein [Lysobacter bugurensis]
MQAIRSYALAAGLATMAFAVDVSAGARDDLNTFAKGLKGLDGRFTQQVFDPNGKLKETATGTVALSTPRLFRWQYAKPYPQTIVADGRTVWVYEPDLEQVTRRPQGVEEQNSPLAALIDPAKLDAQFNVQDAGSKDGLSWLALAPKKEGDSGFRSAKLGFGPTGLVRMHVVDALGQRTEIRFDNWRKNPKFKPATFQFKPPAGVDVIGG